MSAENESIFYASMRSMISLIDKLRDFNLDSYISLPRIAVLGEQSAGKSSLLESICGLNFLPRGTGIVTRRPLELRMVRADVPQPYFTFPKDFGEKKFVQYEEVVRTIEALTEKETQGTKGISSNPIVCTVHSSTVPDLTLIDLPGITRNAVAGQPANIEELSKNLVSNYCTDENTLVLCVIPANIDLSTSDALSFVKKIDRSGSRTLGVLTKIDIMDEGDDCREVLLNKVIPLKHGYVGVKGRSQLDMQGKVLVADAVKKEMEFFAKHPVYSVLPAELLGTRALIDKMSAVLHRMIQAYLPKLRSEVGARIKRARTQLEGLGEEFPESEEKKLELVFKLVRKFKDNFDQAVNGKYYHQKLTRKREKRDAETITFQLNAQFADLFKRYAASDFRISADLTNEQIERALETYQSASIPGFYSIDSFLALVHPKIESLKDPVFHLLEECKSIIESTGSEQLDSALKKFGKLHGEVKEAFNRFLVQQRNTTRRIIEHLVRAEENYIFTNDPTLIDSGGVDRSQSIKDVQVQEMRLRIDNYFFILVRNLRDFVPKLIGQFLVKRFNDNLEVELLNALSKKNYCVDSLNESEVSQSLRAKLRAELTALYNAENLLINSFNLGYSVSQGGLGEVPYALPRAETQESSVAEEPEDLFEIQALNEEFLQFNRDIIANRQTKTVAESERRALRREKSLTVGKRPYIVVPSTPDKMAKSVPPAPHVPASVASSSEGTKNSKVVNPATGPQNVSTSSSWSNPFSLKTESAPVAGENQNAKNDSKAKSRDPFDVPLVQGPYGPNTGKEVRNPYGAPEPKSSSGLSLSGTLHSFSKVFTTVGMSNSSSQKSSATQSAGRTADNSSQAHSVKKPNTGSLFGDNN